MKELVLVRHAKSDWGNEGLRDIDRHLNERGYSDAYLLSTWYAKNKTRPQLIVSSTATRALSTAMIFARELGLPDKDFLQETLLYEATPETILKVVQKQAENSDCLMLFGHNPGLTDFINNFSDGFYIDNLPTCGLVSMVFETASWKLAGKNSGKVQYHQFPKEYKIKNS